MLKLLKALGALCVILLIVSAFIGFQAWKFMNTPASETGQEKMFDVRSGASLGSIGRDLEKQGLITDSGKFVWLARLKNVGNKLQAGRFALNSGWNPARILDTLVNGRPVLYRITIPEGLTWWQTGRLLENNGFVRYEDFSKVISDPEFLRHYGIPFANAEGFLMPDTYLLKKPDPAGGEDADMVWQNQARAVAGRLIDNFWRKADPLWPKSAASANARPTRNDLKRLVTLASIVEKETALAEERARVAGVYSNRLAKNMLLQADPTVIYGLGEKFSGQLLRRHLNDTENAYNTYQNAGLPPGPIASFGVASLKAALEPEKHSYLYFVAIKDGGAHKFSENLAQHNQAVKEYREQKSSR